MGIARFGRLFRKKVVDLRYLNVGQSPTLSNSMIIKPRRGEITSEISIFI
jgi:hypothetical protein